MDRLFSFFRSVASVIGARLKWLALLFAFVGPFMLIADWNTKRLEHEKQTSGVQTSAQIVKTTRVTHRRGADTYELDLTWKDAKGLVWLRQQVPISKPFADSFVKDGRVLRETVAIKYLPEKEHVSPLVLDDFGKADDDESRFWGTLALTIAGVIGSAWAFWPRRVTAPDIR